MTPALAIWAQWPLNRPIIQFGESWRDNACWSQVVSYPWAQAKDWRSR